MTDDPIKLYDWLPVIGYEGIYEVCSDGRVRFLGREVRWRDRNRVDILPPGPVKQSIDSLGYPRVSLSGVGPTRNIRVHNVVADAFLPGPGLVRHLDDVKTNNAVSNLARGTAADNSADMWRNGNGYRRPRPTHCKRSHALEGENVMVDATGRRNCRKCRRAYMAMRYRGVETTEENYAEFLGGE